MDILVAKYSMGVKIDDLKVEFSILLERFHQRWQEGYDSIHFEIYHTFLSVVSFAFLLDEDLKTFYSLHKMYTKSELSDQLIEFIISSKIAGLNPMGKELRYPKIYDELAELYAKSDLFESDQKLKEFANTKWYGNMKACDWYNDHNSKENLHAGYWCFEVAAIAKIKNINDENLKNSKHYPYDLAHYK
jgi:hypothetical protein